jgi:transposase
LLKSENRTSAEVTQILDVCEVVVNNWVRRFCQEGIKGLQTRAGRGRKAILQAETDLTQVREAVSKSRQRISTARAELQSSLTKQFSNSTLKRFLKKTIAATNELEGD